MIAARREDDIEILTFDAGENRLNGPFLHAFEAALDQAENGGAKALVTTGTGRFYSTGLDLEWLGGAGRSEAGRFVFRVQELFARILLFPIPTVAVLNGHAFAGGAMLALAHDTRLMRTERGFFCLPEIDLATGQPLTPGMTALIGSRLARQTFHEALVTGRRYGGEEASEKGLVDAALPEDRLLAEAHQRAASMAGKNRETLVAMKRALYGPVVEALLQAGPIPGGSPPISSGE